MSTYILNNSQYKQLENWLIILINTYTDNPTIGLAKVINYYIDRLLKQDEINHSPNLRCQYVSMKKYWAWKCQASILK